MQHITYSTNFMYLVDYEYDSYYCSGCSGCETGDDYCRGAQYEGLRVVGSCGREGITSLAATVSQAAKIRSTIKSYALERMLLFNKDFVSIMESGSNIWDISACGGYYGEEVNSITLDSSEAIGMINDTLDKLDALSTDNAILAALEAEYGFALPGLSTFELAYIPLKDVRASSKPKAETVKQYAEENEYWHPSVRKRAGKISDTYNNAWGIPVGVMRAPVNGKYSIIDGNHRYEAAKKMFGKDWEKIRILAIVAK